MWILAFSVSFSLLACSSREGERGLLEGAPFSGSGPRLTNVGMELPTGGAAGLDAVFSTERNTKTKTHDLDSIIYHFCFSQQQNRHFSLTSVMHF